MSSEDVAFYVEGVILFMVGIVGCVGNVAAIAVFGRQRLQKNFHALMMALAGFDLLYIIAAIFLFSLPQFSTNYQESGVYWYILPWGLPLAQIGLTGSIYFTMAITVERYVTVCHPFYRVSHAWPAKFMVLPIVAFSILYNVPKFFELRTKVPGVSDDQSFQLNMTVLNGTMEPIEEDKFGISPTLMRLNPYYVTIYCMWLNFLLMGLGPFVILIALNTLTLREIKTMANGGVRPSGLDSAANRKKDIVLSKVSLAIVFVFIVCHSIKWIPNIYELLQVDTGKIVWPHWIEILTNVSHLLTVFNSSVNFYIYFAKHYQSILGRQGSVDHHRTETFRLSSLQGNSHQQHNNKFSQQNSHGLTSTRHRDANQMEEAREDTKMLVNAVVNIVPSSCQSTNGDLVKV